MPKRKRTSANHPSTPQTFSLMDGNVDLLQGLVMHKEAISEEFERELISFVQTQVRPRYGLLLVMCSIFIVIHSHDMFAKPV
jgi:hypothetical protein